MTRLEQFGESLEKWFGRRVPIWVTEYASQTRPEHPAGVTRAQQAANARLALQMAAANPYVEMFVWFILRDSTIRTWRSGLIAKNGVKKPAYAVFAAEAKKIDGQTQIVAPGRYPTITVDVPYLTWYSPPGARVGITYRVYDGKKLLYVAQPRSRIAPDQTVSFVAAFRPVRGKTYTVTTDVGDRNAQHTKRTIIVITEGTPAPVAGTRRR
jgi:hypothetical protein